MAQIKFARKSTKKHAFLIVFLVKKAYLCYISKEKYKQNTKKNKNYGK